MSRSPRNLDHTSDRPAHPPAPDLSDEIAHRIAQLRDAVRQTATHRDPVATTPPPDHAPPDVAWAAQQIERIRSRRARRMVDVRIGKLIQTTGKHAATVQRRLGDLIQLWETHVPPDLASRTTLTALRGGILHVTADSAPVAYELDRLLRGGLLAALRANFTGTLARVKVRVGPGA